MSVTHHSSARLATLVAGIGASAVLLASCTSSSTGAPTSTAAQSSAAAQATASATAQAFGAVGTTETVPCPGYLTTGAAFAAQGNEVEGQTFSCGVVVVPENHDQPDGRTIELFYLRLHSTGASPAAVPLVYLAGGPGSTGSYELTANPLLNQNLNRIRQDRDIIAYDQRGTGYSNYLLCAPFESTLGVLQDRDKNPKIAETIKDLQDTTQGIGYGALRASLCGVGARLLAGVDVSQYNSVASARDIPELVTALGYTDGYDLYGTSYGTTLAQFAMREDPEGVRGVVLDGPSGPSIPNTMWSSTKPVSPYVEIFTQCEADAACAAAYPNLAERFGALLKKLEKDPLVFDPPLQVNPPLTVILPKQIDQIDAEFFRKMAEINNIALNGGFVGAMPSIIKAAEERDVEWFRTSSLAAPASASPTPPASNTTGMGTRPPFQADQPLYEVPFLTLLTLAQNTAQAQVQSSIDGQWVTLVLGDLAARLEAGENQADLMEALLRLSVVPNIGPSAQNLTDYADAYLSPSAATAAKALAAQMDRNDVRATMWNIQDVAMNLGSTPDTRNYSYGMQYAVNCASEIAFTPLSLAKENVAETPYPQLAAYPVKVNQQQVATCLSYPTTLDRSVTDPVVSDIPTLIYVGALDNETPAPWGRTVAEGLSRSTVVEWKNMGHIAAAHDQQYCAGDVAAAFLRDPEQAPDLACTTSHDYAVKWALK
jgi:pimeloyl-ACP methyl ester carboxylesterase